MDDVGHLGKEFRGLRWRGGIDQRLTRMRRVSGIRVNTLARVIGIRTFLSRRWVRSRLRFRVGRGPGAGNIKKRQVFYGAGPGEFRIVKRRITPRGGWKIWPGEKDESDVPQGSGEYGSAGDISFDAAIAEDRGEGNGFRQMGTLEKCGHTAEKILVVAAPGNFQFRLDLARKEDVGRIELRLTKKVEGVSVERRPEHKVRLYRAMPGTWSGGKNPARGSRR